MFPPIHFDLFSFAYTTCMFAEPKQGVLCGMLPANMLSDTHNRLDIIASLSCSKTMKYRSYLINCLTGVSVCKILNHYINYFFRYTAAILLGL